MESDAFHCVPQAHKRRASGGAKHHSRYGAFAQAPQDGRVFFILPWGKYSIVGTTDTFYSGNPDEVTVDQEDRTYLLDALNALSRYEPFGVVNHFIFCGGCALWLLWTREHPIRDNTSMSSKCLKAD